MTYANTTLLGLNQPTTGSESGVWGDDINNGTTQLIEVSIVGSNTISYDGNVTLSVSNGSNASSFSSTTTTSTSSGVAQYPTLILTGARTALRTITAPSSSRIYRVINQTTGGYNTIVNGSATTGVSIPPGASATLIWNGSDFQGVSTVIGTLTFTDTNILASYQTSVNTYSQIVNQNSNSGATASADFIVGNNNTTATTYYGDFGMNSSGFTGSGAFNAANAVYLTATSGDLAIGTTTSNAIHFVVNSGTTDAMAISSSGTVTIGGYSPITSVTAVSAITGTPSSSTYLRGDGTWAAAGTGSVTTVSVVSANGFAGTVANASSTPTITLTTSITGVLKGNGTAISAATAGSDYVAPGTATTFTATQTFNGSSSTFGATLLDSDETVNIVASAPSSTTNFYIQSGGVQYYTSNAANNWTLNIAFSSGTSLNTALSTGQSVTFTLITTQGSTAYYNSAVTIDGTSVTPKWIGGAPSAGNASGLDVYRMAVVKTGSATYTVLASLTQYK